MKWKTFAIVLLATTLICSILTVLHIVYAKEAYDHCSIIYFIAKEIW